MEKIWITGAKGHVGTALSALLDCREYEIFPTDVDEVDVTDLEAVNNYARVNRPDIIINCVGYSDVAGCETNPDKAFAVNAVGTRNLAVMAQSIGAKLIHISTDDIFSGTEDHSYNEFDTPNPRNIYGKSKLAGEAYIQSYCSRYVILRSSWVYGIGQDFLNTVLSAVKDPSVNELTVSEYEYACPTSASELARIIEYFIKNECLGIYHAVCQGSCSRLEYARTILEYANATDKLKLVPANNNKPVYSVLDNMMLRLEHIKQPKNWKDALKEYINLSGGC